MFNVGRNYKEVKRLPPHCFFSFYLGSHSPINITNPDVMFNNGQLKSQMFKTAWVPKMQDSQNGASLV